MRHQFRPTVSILFFALGIVAVAHTHAQAPAPNRSEHVAALLPEIDKAGLTT